MTRLCHDWKAREMGVAEREWRRRERIAHQQRVEDCLAFFAEQRDIHAQELQSSESAAVFP